MVNRLASSLSTYLLAHADNPVDWWPWCDEAFAEARRRDVPVLLSVGYASCHWCHVMARESFSDPEIAGIVNQQFVAIKVDREERPDVDAIYMTATQALTGSGGWPMTCFLTPDGVPFYAGTYFPPRQSSGLPSFRQVLAAMTQAWNDDRPNLMDNAQRIHEALQQISQGTPATSDRQLDAGALDQAATALIESADLVDGGFGGAPKFPPAMVCEFLLRHHERTGSQAALDVVDLTLDKMARGGIFDQLAGGFARYSVDRHWHVPHFEKMLDDNALLLDLYAHHARRTGSTQSARIARETGDFIVRELRTDDGPFAASLDAQAAGEEGLTYVWTSGELRDLLSPNDFAEAARVFGLHDQAGEQVLRRVEEPADDDQFQRICTALRRARDTRPQPARDDIVVLRSNGLAIRALAEAGAALEIPEWIGTAQVAADRLATLHQHSETWYRTSYRGKLGPARATLADLADFAAGLLALYQATGEAARLELAQQILRSAIENHRATDGGYYDTASDAAPNTDIQDPKIPAPVLFRPRDPTDGAAPSGASSLADALLTAAALTGADDLREAAEQLSASSADLIRRFPRSAGRHLAVAEAMLAGPVQIAIVGLPGTVRDELEAMARKEMRGGSVIDIGPPDAPQRPLLAGRSTMQNQPTAYVCKKFLCRMPVTTAADLRTELHAAT